MITQGAVSRSGNNPSSCDGGWSHSVMRVPTRRPIKAHYTPEIYEALQAYQTYLAVPPVLPQEEITS